MLARLSTKEDNSHPSLHLVSQDSAQIFFNGFLPSYLGALPTEFQEYFYRFHLLVRVWFVFIVMALDVLGLLR